MPVNGICVVGPEIYLSWRSLYITRFPLHNQYQKVMWLITVTVKVHMWPHEQQWKKWFPSWAQTPIEVRTLTIRVRVHCWLPQPCWQLHVAVCFLSLATVHFLYLPGVFEDPLLQKRMLLHIPYFLEKMPPSNKCCPWIVAAPTYMSNKMNTTLK